MSFEKGVNEFVDELTGVVGGLFERPEKRTQGSRRDDEDDDPKFIPFAVVPGGLTAGGIFLPDVLPQTPPAGFLTTAADAIHTLGDYVPVLGALTLAVGAVDVFRWNAHRHRIALTRTARQIFNPAGPKQITVPTFRTPGALRQASLYFRRGTYIDPKQLERFTATVNATNLHRGDTEHKYLVTHFAPNAQIDIRRDIIAPDLRSPIHIQLQKALDSASGVLPDAKVTVAERDDNGDEISYKITWTTNLRAAASNAQDQIAEVLKGTVGPHPSERLWDIKWYPHLNEMLMYLKEPIPKKVLHPIPEGYAAGEEIDWTKVGDGERLHVPYAAGEGGVVAYWNMSHRSTGPHFLCVGPTGGGKTSLIRTALTGSIKRGVAWLCVDPKRIELQGMVGYPGVECVIPDPMRAARFIRGLEKEMMARYRYMEAKHVDPSDMPVFGICLDEFYILSSMWKQLQKSPKHADEIKELDPFGAMGQILALIRSAGGRMLVGIQRPDAKFFGDDAGSVRANFKTRASLSSLDQDGAMMFWGDATAGRTVDASTPGRATVADAEGNPMPAQVYWTPDVDPLKARNLKRGEPQMLTRLRPATEPKMQFYSYEFAELVTMEQEIREKTTAGSVAEPITIGGRNIEELEDAIPASDVKPGMTILMDDGTGTDTLIDVVVLDVKTSVNHKALDPSTLGDKPSDDDLAEASKWNKSQITRITARPHGAPEKFVLSADFGRFETVFLPAGERPGLVAA